MISFNFDHSHFFSKHHLGFAAIKLTYFKVSALKMGASIQIVNAQSHFNYFQLSLALLGLSLLLAID
jgi:hypothetical protein